VKEATMSEPMISNQPMDEIARLTLAAREAMTDAMVERIAATGANALELVDRLNDEQTNAAVHKLLDRLTEAHKLGALDTLFDFLTLLHAARDAATDNILERLFTFFEQMINTVGNEEMGMLAENTRNALEEAAEETQKTPVRRGLKSMLSMLSKPETQRGLAFLIAFSAKLQHRTMGQ
jgi:uncharacterized protein YjgD (DUF1641 family)